MDEVKKKVLLDLFVSPWTLLPTVTGLSAWMLSWAAGGNMTLNLIGLAGVVIGAGIQATRLIFGVEELTEQAYGYQEEKKRADRNSHLDQLAERLARDDDNRTEECLRRLRALHGLFEQDPPKGAAAIAIRDNVQRLFEASVRHLEHSYDLWEKARRLPVGTGGPLLEQRRAAIDEVVLTVNHLTRTVERYNALQADDGGDHELSQLRKELDATIEVARRADEQMDSLGKSPAYDEKEFE
ncbi:hypothetical protein Pla108_36670 [Botrimarina colliarenosi]|uniref:5-bromo-4-chloroindolyl phosphate hydrolysis protein n=1 Tax=Botrimarina colliarenosi TaxID=2528001 RepID=A0A5C6A5V5_9BACT|nr:hypothetical protein [Botrimarina colliarenosi]TWT94816.1 hypothetical protein Pla108_36670 [Botrimarina colliarenosi]